MSLKLMLNDEPPVNVANIQPQAPSAPLPSHSADLLNIGPSRHSPPPHRSYGDSSDFASRVPRDRSPDTYERLPPQGHSSQRTRHLSPGQDAPYLPSPSHPSTYPPHAVEVDHEYHPDVAASNDNYRYSSQWDNNGHHAHSTLKDQSDIYRHGQDIQPSARSRRQKNNAGGVAAVAAAAVPEATSLDGPVSESVGRKRRKVNEDSEYQPGRRYPTRRNPTRSKQFRSETPSTTHEPIPPRAPTREELRLASSDLDDCREVWLQDMSEYVLETQKRQTQVRNWFEQSIVSRNNDAARTMSRKYKNRIKTIPQPVLRQIVAPRPPEDLHGRRRSMSPGFADANELGLELGTHSTHRRGHRDFDAGAEDAEELMAGEIAPRKRIVHPTHSEASSDVEVSSMSRGHTNKKRRMEHDFDDGTDDRSIMGDDASQSISAAIVRKSSAGKGKGKGRGTPVPSNPSDIVSGKARRKGTRRKGDLSLLGHELGPPSASASVAGDVTPAASVPPSPALSASVIYELGDIAPPLKKAKKIDDAAMQKRLSALEDAQRKVWTNIARRDVAKVYKYHLQGFQARQLQHKRTALQASTQAKKPFARSMKSAKDTQVKAKRLMREMMVFWKKNEKEERDLRKRAEKEADNRLKEEEERREAARQARKLEFLISQTELYSHFVGSKLKTAELEGDGVGKGSAPKGADVADADPSALGDIDFDDEDETVLHQHARKNAKEAIALARQRATQFDTQAALERKTNEALALAKAQAHIRDDTEEVEGAPGVAKTTPLVDLDSDELNFQNPTSLSGTLTIAQPRMLMAQLKEYQLKGLNWLATLYEQGINGILADEMGLGKTVQSISLLAYLVETHDIWGPFLVVAPASTLHNWQQEITRFVPKLKALPYWGNVKDRATLRKFWSKKDISYNQDAPFHVLITSYQLILQDQQYFRAVKWQYMILDEAQNIKNSSSGRWKTLLSFQCRNRLLLTGTPIQNNMQELWALLHFIMPSLFDSHDEFNEWFSKDIENAAAENKGSKLNEHQLRRLHMILKPFMLRRVKRHVQNELSDKIEIDIYVDLSARQRALYRALRANVSVADLLEKAANIGDADAARSLMNLVMQFRKVCNHPELFERADVVAPFSFCNYGRPGAPMRQSDFISCYYSTRSAMEYSIPEMFYLDGGLVDIPAVDAKPTTESGILRNLTNIWNTDWIQRSIEEDERSPFNFAPLLGMSASEVHELHHSPTVVRMLRAAKIASDRSTSDAFSLDSDFAAHTRQHVFRVGDPVSLRHLETTSDLPALHEVALDSWNSSCLSRAGMQWFVPPAVAPPSSVYCSDRTFLDKQSQLLDAPLESLALYGLPPNAREELPTCDALQNLLPGVPPVGLVGCSPNNQLPASYMQVPEAKRLIYDSAKLARLDSLLHELKSGDHRVLIYFQMTRMMDLMEEYLIYRQYKYLRLDGSSKIEDRRDMVMDWQTRPDIFIFLLSTRAGGLGINLTAADTVVFYDHDWNPSNDAQAMDRAHRLGQTRQVTVYRLITKGTIDERIVQLARVKKDVQDIVVGNKSFTDVAKPNEIVSLLLNDDELANLESQGSSTAAATSKKSGKKATGTTDETSQAVRDLWQEEGDDFFGAQGNATVAPNSTDGVEEDSSTPAPIGTGTRGKKRRGQGGGTRGRKPATKGAKRKPAGDTIPEEF